MSDDLDYVRAHIPDYRGYGDEDALHDSDQRVRARVGELLALARERFAGTLDAATAEALDAEIFRCMFGDQRFIRKFDHADLDDAAEAAITASDRALIELGEKASAADESHVAAALAGLDAEFERRRSPELIRK